MLPLERKRLLVVDDSEIDRAILVNILSEEFDILETDNGYRAIELVTQLRHEIDAIMLDISMPLISGFDVLRLIKNHGIENIPVFLISAEATRDNVVKASEFNVAEFIGKPYEREDILRRVKSRLGVVTNFWLTMEDITETNRYITDLGNVYRTYLTNFERDDMHYVNMIALMKILLQRYAAKNPNADLTRDKMDIISKAAYFCDIGMMLVPGKNNVSSREPEVIAALQETHTKMGASIIRLNHSKHCEFFMQVASDMCIYHHERYDGHGYPRGIGGKDISIYNQMCRLVDEFDMLFSKFFGSNELKANFVMKRLAQDDGMVSPELYSLLEDCKPSIMNYYTKLMRSI